MLSYETVPFFHGEFWVDVCDFWVCGHGVFSF